MMKKIVLSRKKAYELVELIHKMIFTEMDVSQFFDLSVLDEENSEIDLIGFSNGFLSEIIQTITGYEVEICGEVFRIIEKE